MRKLLVGLGVGFALFLVSSLLVPFLVDLDGRKGALLARMAEQVSGEIDFQHLELTLLRGVGLEVHGLTFEHQSSWPVGLSVQVEKLRVQLRLLPLLRKRISVKGVFFQEPTVRLRRLAEGGQESPGAARVADARPGGSGRAGEVERGAAGSRPSTSERRVQTTAAEKQSALLALILVDELTIEGGRIVFEDDLLSSDGGPVGFEDVDLRIRDLSLERPASVEFAAGIPGAAGQLLHLAGWLGPLGKEWRWDRIPFACKVTLKELPATRLPYLPQRGSPVRVASGSISLDVTASGSPSGQVLLESVLEGEGLSLELSALTEGEERTGIFALGVRHQGMLDLPARILTTEAALVSVNQDRLALKGTVRTAAVLPEWELDAWSEKLHPDLLLALFPMLQRHWPPELRIEGPVGLWLRSVGNPESLKWETRLGLDASQVLFQKTFRKPAGVPFSLEGQGTKEGGRFLLDRVRLIHPELGLGLSGEVLPGPRPQFSLVLESEPLSLATLAGFFPPIACYRPEGRLLLRGSWRGSADDALLHLQLSSDGLRFRVPSSPSEPLEEGSVEKGGTMESLDVGVQLRKRPEGSDGEVEIQARKGVTFSVPWEGLAASLQISPEQVRVSSLECLAFGGDVKATGAYDRNSRAWVLRPVLRGVSVSEMLSRYRDLFSGVLSGDLVMECQPMEGQPASPRVRARVRVSQGEIRNLGLVDVVWDTLFRTQGVTELMSKLGAGTGSASTTRFDWLEGRVESTGRQAQVDFLQLHNVRSGRATDSDVFLAGKVGLEDEALALQGRVVLSSRHSERLVRQAGVLKALTDAEGRVSLPFRLQGSIPEPLPLVDLEYVAGALARYSLRQGLPEGVKTRQEEAGEPWGQSIDELLKGLIR